MTKIQRLYSLDGENWQTYKDESIRVELGQTLYAKGIDVFGNETRIISTYTRTLPSDALGAEAYDGDDSTGDTIKYPTMKYIKISPEMREKKYIYMLIRIHY